MPYRERHCSEAHARRVAEEPNIVTVENHIGGGSDIGVYLQLREGEVGALIAVSDADLTGDRLEIHRLYGIEADRKAVLRDIRRGSVHRGDLSVGTVIGGNQDVKVEGKPASSPARG